LESDEFYGSKLGIHSNFKEVDFTIEDALCLGSDKLRLISGDNLTNNAEYRLDNDASTKIIQSNSDNNIFFTLYKGSGETLVFGVDDDTRDYDYHTGEIYNWRLAYKENNVSQRINYEYDLSNENEVYLDSQF